MPKLAVGENRALAARYLGATIGYTENGENSPYLTQRISFGYASLPLYILPMYVYIYELLGQRTYESSK